MARSINLENKSNLRNKKIYYIIPNNYLSINIKSKLFVIFKTLPKSYFREYSCCSEVFYILFEIFIFGKVPVRE